MELFKLFGTIALNNSDANKGIEKTTNLAEGAAQKIGTAFEKVGSAAVAVGKTVAVGVGAAATAISALTKEAVQSYADYEQLVGGVETLFKNFSGMVQRNAENAYKTAGLSANEYMETVTSFSASLLQSLNGNVYASAKVADMAITDMSDNANKMGTSMTMIQNAYQGFAKQNYTMLDNLKLGYGGTKEEMQRLIDDANLVKEANGEMADLSISSFADVVEAIHTIQTETGITGTTAKEAASTISGSLAMTKSAWKNLVVGIADENANIEELIDEFVESVGIVAENIIPRIEVALVGAGEMVERLLPVIVDRVPQIINEVLPDILNSAASIVQSLVQGMSDNKELLASAAFDTVSIIVQTIADLLPEILSIGLDMLVALANGIVDNIDQISSSASEVVTEIVEILTNPETLSSLIGAAVEIIIAIANGMIQHLTVLTEAAVSVITQIVDELMKDDNLDDLVDAAIEILVTIASGLIENLPELTEAAIELVAKLIEYILAPDNMTKLLTTAFDLVSELCEGLLNNVNLLEEKADELANAFKETFLSVDWEGVGRSALDAIKSGLGDFALKSYEITAKAMVPGAGMVIDAVKDKETRNAIGDVLVGAASVFNAGGYGNAMVGTFPVGSHASGLDYVPYDGYVAELHEGEMVVPAAESRYLRSGGLGSANAEVLMMLERILYAVQDQDNKSISLSVNNREFARMVKAVT